MSRYPSASGGALCRPATLLVAILALGWSLPLWSQTTKSWIFNGADSWNSTNRWAPNNTPVPDGPEYFAYLGSNINANRTITLDGDKTVGFLFIGDLGGTQRFTLAEGSGGHLEFDAEGSTIAFINKNRGGEDTITADLLLTDDLYIRHTIGSDTRELVLAGEFQGTGDIVVASGFNGRIQITGDNTASTNDLYLLGRSANQRVAHQVQLNASTGNAVGGDVFIHNGSVGGTGFAVLELAQGRSNLDQIDDTATVIMDGVGGNAAGTSGRKGFFNLMGGNETIGRIIDLRNSAVVQNMETQNVNTNAVLTIAGNEDSHLGNIVRDHNDSATGTGTLGIVKQGTGTLTLEGANIRYTGDTIVEQGTLIIDDVSNFASTITVNSGATLQINRAPNNNLNFDDPINGAGGNLVINAFGGANSQVTLQSAGNTVGQLRVDDGRLVIGGANNTFASVLIDGDPARNRDLYINGNNTTVTGDFFVNGEYGSGTSLIRIQGTTSIGGAVDLTNTRMLLQGANGSIGSPTSITLAGRSLGSGSSGRFEINNTTANANRVGDSVPFFSRGGTIAYNGGAGTNETLGQLSLVEGALEFETTGSGNLTFNAALLRSEGTTVNFANGTVGTDQKVLLGSAPTLTQGMLAWATRGRNDFATYDGTNGFQAFTGYNNNVAQGSWTSTTNLLWNSLGNQELNANRSLNSLNLQQEATRALTIPGGLTLTIESGGIISDTENAGGRTHSIAGTGALTAGAAGGYELFFHTPMTWNQGNDTRILRVNARVEDNGVNSVSLSKTGQGVTFLQNTNNSYTGKTYVNAGFLRIAGEGSLGTAPGSLVTDHVQISGGTLQFTNNFSLTSANRGITFGQAGGRFEVGISDADTSTITVLSPVQGQGVVELAVRPNASLTIGNGSSSNTFSKGIKTDLYNGTINILGNNTIGGIFVETANISVTGDNTITGDIAVRGGTLSLDGTNSFDGSVSAVGGTLRLLSDNALGGGGTFFNLGSNTLPGFLDLAGSNQTATGLSGGTDGIIRNNTDTSGDSIFTLDFDRTYTYNGRFQNGNANGTLGLTKTGPGTLRLINQDSDFSGPVRIEEGAISVRNLNYVGLESSLGIGSLDPVEFLANPADLVLNGGALDLNLQFGNVTDRTFTLGSEGGTIAATGFNRDAAITFGVDFEFFKSPQVAFEGSGERTLTLAGYNGGINQFNLSLGDAGTDATSLLKIGSGGWTISKRQAFTGLTTIENGRLAAAVDGAFGTEIPLTNTTVDATDSFFTGDLEDGMPVRFSGTTLPAGIEADRTYYVLFQGLNGANTFQVSETHGGFTPVSLGSAGSGVQYSMSAGLGINLVGGNLELSNVNYTTPEEIFFNGGRLFADENTNSSWAGDWWVNTPSTIFASAGSTIEFSGTLRGNRNLQLDGEGTFIFSGNADPQSGAGWDNGARNMQVRAGTLILDYSSDNTSKIPDQTNVTLGGGAQGGIIRLVGGSHIENTAGTTIIDRGANEVYRDSGTSKIRLNDFRRLAGGSLYIDQERIVQTDFDNINGIIGGWATVGVGGGQLSWAAKDGNDNQNNRDIIGFSGYVINDFQPTENTDVTSSYTQSADGVTNTLRFNTPGDITLTLAGGNNEITTGGILISPAVGDHCLQIVGPGALYTGNAVSNRNNTGAEANLIFNQFNTSGPFVVTAPIIDNPNPVSDRSGQTNSNNRRIQNLVGGTADLYVGQFVTGPGIPAGAFITNVINGNQIEINVAHTYVSGDTLSFPHSNGVDKVGPGLMALLGDHSYSGGVFIGGGTLLVDSIRDGGLDSSLGSATLAPGNISFSGGELLYIGEDADVNRGFNVTESARWSVGHEATTLILNGDINGNDRLEKGGPGRLVLTFDERPNNEGAPLTEWLLDEGTLELRSSDRNNRFASTLVFVNTRGGDLDVIGDPTANRVEALGGQLTVSEGSSQIQVTSAGDGTPRDIRLDLNGVDEVEPVIREVGGTVHFVENPTEGGGDASIRLLVPVEDRALITPWASYEDTLSNDPNLFGNSQPGVNNFAAVTLSTQDVVSADFLSLHDIGSGFLDPNNWLLFDDPSEGNLAAGGFAGTLTQDVEVNTLRYFNRADGVIDTDGFNIRIVSGGIMVGYNVRDTMKSIVGSGTLSGGFLSDGGGRDLILHNYNQSQPFTIGASIVNDVTMVTSNPGFDEGASVNAGSNIMEFGFGSSVEYFQLQVGMVVSGPGIAPGTVITALDSFSGLFAVLSNPATTDQNLEAYDFEDTTHFTQTGPGTTILSGDNQYAGNTYVTGGVLRLDSANALPGGIGTAGGTSALIIDDAVIGLGAGDFTRNLGTGADQVRFNASGGFAAYGADRQINFGGAGAEVAWGEGQFLPYASSLILGSHDSTHNARFMNAIDLNVLSQVVRAEDGFGDIDGELVGSVSGKAQLIKRGLGQLRISGSNSYTGGTAVEEGTLFVADQANVLGDVAGVLEIGNTSHSRVNGEIDVYFEGGSVANPVQIGNVNSEGNTVLGFDGPATLTGSVGLGRDTFIGSTGAANHGTINGVVSGSGGLTVIMEGGSVTLGNGSNTFGSGGGAPGDAVDGGSVVRYGALVAGATGALGSTTVELGGPLPQVLSVDRATTGRSLTSQTGFFTTEHNGVFPTPSAGAFLQVSDTIDGRTFTRSDAGVRVLIKDENGEPGRNGIYEVVFFDIPIGAPDPQPAGTMNLIRVADFDESSEMPYGTRIEVLNGTENAGTSHFIANTPSTVNDNALHFRRDFADGDVALLATGDGTTVANAVDINATNGAGLTSMGGDSGFTSGQATFSGPVVLRDLDPGVQETKELTIVSETPTLEGISFTGGFSEADTGGTGTDDILSIMKSGTGVATFTAPSTYTGNTIVSAGTLLVNNAVGSGTGLGTVTVNAGATLGGRGTIAGVTTVTGTGGSPAFLSPGSPSDPAGVGTLTFNSQLTLGADSQVLFTLASNGVNDRVTADTLSVDNSTLFKVSLDSGYLDLDFGHSFDLLNWAGLIGDTDIEDNLDLPDISGLNLVWDTSLFNSQGVISIAVPEPARAMLLIVGLVAAVLRRRR